MESEARTFWDRVAWLRLPSWLDNYPTFVAGWGLAFCGILTAAAVQSRGLLGASLIVVGFHPILLRERWMGLTEKFGGSSWGWPKDERWILILVGSAFVFFGIAIAVGGLEFRWGPQP